MGLQERSWMERLEPNFHHRGLKAFESNPDGVNATTDFHKNTAPETEPQSNATSSNTLNPTSQEDDSANAQRIAHEEWSRQLHIIASSADHTPSTEASTTELARARTAP